MCKKTVLSAIVNFIVSFVLQLSKQWIDVLIIDLAIDRFCHVCNNKNDGTEALLEMDLSNAF